MSRTVHLHVGRHPHPIYREQLHAAPPGWEYGFADPALGDATAPVKRVVERRSRLAPLRERGESLTLRAASELGYVHFNRAPGAGADLVHSAERLLWGSEVPYVLDFEHLALFTIYQRAALGRPWTRAVLERALADERLRFLLPWSQAAATSIETCLGERASARLARKVRVVSPAIRAVRERPPEPGGGGALRILFVGTLFVDKGGVEAVRAVARLSSTHEVHLDLVSYVPEEWRARCAVSGCVTVHEPGGIDLVHALYARSDVLLFPSHMDTFGYVVLEAMAHGLPVLAPRHLALAETVLDGESGLLFEPENMMYDAQNRIRFRHVLPPPRAYVERLQSPGDAYVDGIAAQLARLAEDHGLRARLAEGALASVRDGHLSMARRREALADIYSAAAG